VGTRPTRTLIVNADDFGQSVGINRGVMLAHTGGIVTSASLMVRWPAAPDAVRRARHHPNLDLGLHFDLGEWSHADGGWTELHPSPVQPDDPRAVEAEALRQLELFRQLVGRDPSHLDSHQHVHREEPARSVLLSMAAELGVPIRDLDPEVGYLGVFYGQTGTGEPYPSAITVEALLGVLERLPSGVTELGCHPGLGVDLRSMYSRERAAEVKALTDRRVQRTVVTERIDLRTFRDLRSFDRPGRSFGMASSTATRAVSR
jgi:predicted glycoside hydrolase/deacetylase ChbG (UPF0249 family)